MLQWPSLFLSQSSVGAFRLKKFVLYRNMLSVLSHTQGAQMLSSSHHEILLLDFENKAIQNIYK